MQRKGYSESQEVSPEASADVESQLGSVPTVHILPKGEGGLGVFKAKIQKGSK